MPRSAPAKASLKADRQIHKHLPVAPTKVRQALAIILADVAKVRSLGVIAFTIAQCL